MILLRFSQFLSLSGAREGAEGTSQEATARIPVTEDRSSDQVATVGLGRSGGVLHLSGVGVSPNLHVPDRKPPSCSTVCPPAPTGAQKTSGQRHSPQAIRPFLFLILTPLALSP